MKNFLSALLAALIVTSSYAQTASQSKELVVVLPKDLPETAQVEGQSMDLHSLNNGKTYLYLEQQQFGRIAILDVSNPAHIAAVGTEHLDLQNSFDFVRSLGGRSTLVCYRDNRGSAVVDYRNPKHPTLTATEIGQAAHAQAIGESGLLVMNEPRLAIQPPARNYQVIDTTDSRIPKLLATVNSVQQVLMSDETGTTYLLGSGGLTVVRQPLLEQERQAAREFTN